MKIDIQGLNDYLLSLDRSQLSRLKMGIYDLGRWFYGEFDGYKATGKILSHTVDVSNLMTACYTLSKFVEQRRSYTLFRSMIVTTEHKSGDSAYITPWKPITAWTTRRRPIVISRHKSTGNNELVIKLSVPESKVLWSYEFTDAYYRALGSIKSSYIRLALYEALARSVPEEEEVIVNHGLKKFKAVVESFDAFK